MKLPIVSIIVPVYNTESGMLEKCFQSIFAQTVSDFELIIVDDGSDENTASFLDSFFSAYPEVTVLHIENGGASVARNTGIGVAKGEYITFVDADDWLSPDYLKTLLEQFDDSTQIVMCTRCFEYRNQSKENHFFEKNMQFTAENKKSLIYKSITTGVAGTWCKVYRRSFLDTNNLRYDVSLRRTQDIIFNLYAFQAADKVKYIDICLYHYRMQNNSVTKKYNPKADDILGRAAQAFVEFTERYYPDDEMIQKGLKYKCLNILNEISKLMLFNPQWETPLKERCSKAADVCEKPVYRNAITQYSIKEYPSVLGKIRLLLLKRKAYRSLFNLYRLQLLAEYRRNYS